MNKFKKIIIIGAPRSGTNILRDVISSFDGFCTWPCDEINYIWRHGNVHFLSDEIPAHKSNNKIEHYVNNRFQEIADKYSADVVIEKTCANSLRVPFIEAVIPDARYIFIYRDGIDATGSAKDRWTAKLDVPYILKKIKFVPKIDLPYYAFRYLWARMHRFISREKRLAFWGPALNNMSDILQNHSLNEVCALQWQKCVDKAEEAFSSMSASKVIRVRYEDFVTKPTQEIDRILEFIGQEVGSEEIRQAVKPVTPSSIGKGRKALGVREVSNLEQLIGDTLKRYDYL